MILSFLTNSSKLWHRESYSLYTILNVQGKRDSREEIDKIFRLFDEEGTGKISFKNLKKIAQEIGETLTDEELYEMLEEADRDNDGMINPEEFYRYFHIHFLI